MKEVDGLNRSTRDYSVLVTYRYSDEVNPKLEREKIMDNNQIDPNQEPNQLSDEELEAVAGGSGERPVVDALIDAGKDFGGDLVDAGKDLISDVRDVLPLI